MQSQFQSQLLLLLLAAATLLIQAAIAAQHELPFARPGCPDRCGNTRIPFPFGMKPGCFREGFEVTCNHSFHPPRAFLGDKEASGIITLESSYSESVSSPGNYTFVEHKNNTVSAPIELIDISVAKSEARAYGAAASACGINATERFLRYQVIVLEAGMRGPFVLSSVRNVLTGIGLVTYPMLYKYRFPLHFALKENLLVACRSSLMGKMWLAENGSCSGRGCCHASISEAESGDLFGVEVSLPPMIQYTETNPCSYAMVAESSWYNFSTMDLYGNDNKFTRGVPFAIDFAIRDASCPVKGQQPPPDYACVSGNSSCANVTNGYVCKCLEHYEGNPYITNGCQDIDECKHPNLYPCSSDGICKNRPSGYDCPCKPGMKGDGKAGTCREIFPLVAKMVVGVVGGFFVMAIPLFLTILCIEKKKTRELYRKNGGSILEKANMIKLFKKEELKPILKSKNLIGKGYFGEVYKGLLDNKLVAVKKPISGNALENEQFANEVIIQSQVIHKNIVRLIGCCLEVDTPMLVYEFLPKGNLDGILHNNNKAATLNLDVRLSIAASAADGLAYMHSQTSTKILHGDVKPANILLDDNFMPKISDFGISRLIARDKQHTDAIIGDKSYMDPVYKATGLLTEKSDVYSFGVVILELISRKRATYSNNHSLVRSFLEAHKEGRRATNLFDEEIAATSKLELLDSLARIAVECLNPDVDQRPSMIEVAERLLLLNRSHRT
ncbi:hypothetical protein VPH35_005904 [Triticum aestivum]|nr:wall-associated receptor kinase 1-like [Triticum aestivum]